MLWPNLQSHPPLIINASQEHSWNVLDHIGPIQNRQGSIIVSFRFVVVGGSIFLELGGLEFGSLSQNTFSFWYTLAVHLACLFTKSFFGSLPVELFVNRLEMAGTIITKYVRKLLKITALQSQQTRRPTCTQTPSRFTQQHLRLLCAANCSASKTAQNLHC